MRAARFFYRPSSLLALDCGGFGTQGCHSWMFNWRHISDGYCDEYFPGTFEQIYFAVQLRDNEGNWYSTSYSPKQSVLNGDEIGWTGMSGKSMCVKNDTYGWVYDRILKGMSDAVNAEVCQDGYSKFPINLWVGTDNNTHLTVSVPYEAPPVKRNYPNTYRNAEGVLMPACGYTWANKAFSDQSPSADYTVTLLPGFVVTPGGVKPAKNYRWKRNDGTYYCTVEPIPAAKRVPSKKPVRKVRT